MTSWAEGPIAKMLAVQVTRDKVLKSWDEGLHPCPSLSKSLGWGSKGQGSGGQGSIHR